MAIELSGLTFTDQADIVTAFGGEQIFNTGFANTLNGDDTITSSGVLYNEGVIETGNGDDYIRAYGDYDDITGTRYPGINNNGGSINMGDGNDSIIAHSGFEAGENSSGSVFLGEGEDSLYGFGSGEFSGGNGNDTLALTRGTYTVGKWYTAVTFTKDNQLMITTEFEKLTAGLETYDFASLTNGQTITYFDAE